MKAKRGHVAAWLLLGVPGAAVIGYSLYVRFTNPVLTETQLFFALWQPFALLLVWAVLVSAILLWIEFKR